MKKDSLITDIKDIQEHHGINQVIAKIVQELTENRQDQEISYTDIGNYLIDGPSFYVSPELVTHVLELCHRKIRDEMEKKINS